MLTEDPSRCPSCNHLLVFAKADEYYCDNCGWPDEKLKKAEIMTPEQKLAESILELVKSLRQKGKKEMPTTDLHCPFCGEGGPESYGGGYDLPGLKSHLRGDCEVFEKVEAL